MKTVKYPTIKDLSAIVRSIKKEIQNDYRAFDEDEMPGIQLTVGFNPKSGEWDYQKGDNSYTGSAYGYKDWAVVGVYRKSNSREVARDILDQLEQLHWQ